MIKLFKYLYEEFMNTISSPDKRCIYLMGKTFKFISGDQFKDNGMELVKIIDVKYGYILLEVSYPNNKWLCKPFKRSSECEMFLLRLILENVEEIMEEDIMPNLQTLKDVITYDAIRNTVTELSDMLVLNDFKCSVCYYCDMCDEHVRCEEGISEYIYSRLKVVDK